MNMITNTNTSTARIRYATTKAIPVGYNYARAMPNATFPKWFEAARKWSTATHQLHRDKSGAVLWASSLG
ncbi:MAG: hypothetical protein FJY48_11715 [Betaproteobacteria bacterium]|nr:hypothetical protein [Betaproteobacteria bacterium]